MKKTLFASVLCTIDLVSCENTVKPDPEKSAFKTQDSVSMADRGKYLVTIAGCNDCHSPKRMGPKGPELIPELLLSGYQSSRPLPEFDVEKAKKGFAQMNEDMTAAAGPWGISFAANLTPHETGLGNWTFENFKRAMTHGKYKGLENGRTLLPPMPWFNYTEMKKEDLQAIHAYLKTLKPVENVVPNPVSWEK